MTTTPARQPQGIPTGGQFAPTAHREAAVTLTAPERKNPEWYAAAAELTADGRSLEEARTGLTALLALQTTRTLFNAAHQHLRSGNETTAAMLTIAGSALRDLPAAVQGSSGDLAKAKDAVSAARRRLNSSAKLLDMVHPSGRQPIIQGADEVLADFEEFLAADCPQ